MFVIRILLINLTKKCIQYLNIILKFSLSKKMSLKSDKKKCKIYSQNLLKCLLKSYIQILLKLFEAYV